jgi:hypothetical protein
MTHPMDIVNAKQAVTFGEYYGDPELWICIAKYSNDTMMRSTKAMAVEGIGVLVQVSSRTKYGDEQETIAEALQFIFGAIIVKYDKKAVIKGTVNEEDIGKVFDETTKPVSSES